MGGVKVTRTDMGDGQIRARLAEVWSGPGVGFRGSMSPSLAMDLGMCDREGGAYRRAGTLTFTPDGEETELAAERVVRVGKWCAAAGDLYNEDGSRTWFEPGRYAIRRIPDAKPEPVAVYERPWCRALQCSECGFPLNTTDLGGKCGNVDCGKPLAPTASPWPGTGGTE